MTDKPFPITSRFGARSLDGEGAGDHDQPFAGFRAYVFNTRQLARLLQVRGELLEARLGHGQWASDVLPAH